MHAWERNVCVGAAVKAARRRVGMHRPRIQAAAVKVGVDRAEADDRQRIRSRDDSLHVAQAALASQPAAGVRARRGATRLSGSGCCDAWRDLFPCRIHAVVGDLVVTRRLFVDFFPEDPARGGVWDACGGQGCRRRLRGGFGRQQRAGAVRSSGVSARECPAHDGAASAALTRVGEATATRRVVAVVVFWRHGEHGVPVVDFLGRCAAHCWISHKGCWVKRTGEQTKEDAPFLRR
mmetsp:Transcript_11261/g.34989  ORF Transcript_11261/g.34989 Transcript_11261/m.34989 type:complete len:235 (+) Transcript_11261:1178-1882(+)